MPPAVRSMPGPPFAKVYSLLYTHLPKSATVACGGCSIPVLLYSLQCTIKRKKAQPLSVSKNLPLRGRCPEGAEGENLAITRNISGNRTVLSPPPAGGAPSQRGQGVNAPFSTVCSFEVVLFGDPPVHLPRPKNSPRGCFCPAGRGRGAWAVRFPHGSPFTPDTY